MSGKKAPDAFRTIGEVADWLGVSAHVLRFWETKFPQIKPVKRAGGRRYYRPQDMALLGGLKQLLHEDGLTIKGAQKLLREKGVRAVCDLSPPFAGAQETPVAHEEQAQTSGVSEASPPPPAADQPEGAAPRAAAGEPPRAEPDTPTLPPRAPLPGAQEGQLGLFADLPPFEGEGPSEASAPPTSGLPAAESAAEPSPPISSGPSVAPLPGQSGGLVGALGRLSPGHIPAATVAPLLARARALRARMDRAA